MSRTARQAPPDVTNTAADRAGRVLREWMADPGRTRINEHIYEAYLTVSRYRAMHAYPLQLVTSGMRNFVFREAPDGIVGQRFKRMVRIVNKLSRLPSIRLSQMEDIGGCRAIVETQAEVGAIASRMRRARWEIVRDYNYARDPKPSGYRARHIIVRRRGRLVEIQLRTPSQHEWAEAVEDSSARTGFDIKDGLAPADLLLYFEKAAFMLAMQAEGEEPDEAFWKEFDTLRDQVTPYFVRRP